MAQAEVGGVGPPHPYVKREVVSEYLTLASLAALVGTVSGLVALGFRYLVWIFLNLFHAPGGLLADPVGLLAAAAADPGLFDLDANVFYATAAQRLALFLILPLGGLLVGVLATRFAPEVRGTGIAQTMEAVLVRQGEMRPRVTVLKSLASAITIGTGGSAGREGPIVQIGAASGSLLAQRLGLTEAPRKILLACGAAGAIAATFNAPIAGVVFALELILLELRTRSFIPLVIATVFASAVASLFLPSGPILPAQYAFDAPVELGFFILLGLVCGFFAILWIRLLFGTERLLGRARIPAYLLPVLGMGLLALLGLAVPEVLGVGYATLEAAVAGTLVDRGASPVVLAILVLLGIAVLKMVATGLTLGSGGSGGAFAPSLFMGALVGAAVGIGLFGVFPTMASPVEAFALVGMGALLAGATRATFTSIVMVFELTGDFRFILPVMLAAVVADGVSVLLERDTLFSGVLRRRGVLFEPEAELNILRTIPVRHAMVTEVETVHEEDAVEAVSQRMIATGYQGFPVVDDAGRIVGIVTHADVRRALQAEQHEATVADVETQKLIVARPNESLEEAMERMAIAGIGHLPVVAEEDPDRIVGFLSRGDVIRAYRRKALEERHEVFRRREVR